MCLPGYSASAKHISGIPGFFVMKKWIKHAVKIALEGNLSPSAIIVVIIKKPVLILLDEWSPDEEKK